MGQNNTPYGRIWEIMAIFRLCSALAQNTFWIIILLPVFMLILHCGYISVSRDQGNFRLHHTTWQRLPFQSNIGTPCNTFSNGFSFLRNCPNLEFYSESILAFFLWSVGLAIWASKPRKLSLQLLKESSKISGIQWNNINLFKREEVKAESVWLCTPSFSRFPGLETLILEFYYFHTQADRRYSLQRCDLTERDSCPPAASCTILFP